MRELKKGEQLVKNLLTDNAPKYLQMSGLERGDTRDPGGAVRAGQPEHQDIEDQRARVRRLREEGAAEYEIRPALKQLESMLREAILEQGARVRRLRSDTAGKAVIAEAERRLESLKAEFLADTGREWSEVREEGPVLLTTNEVRGSEVRPALKLELKHLTRGNVLR